MNGIITNIVLGMVFAFCVVALIPILPFDKIGGRKGKKRKAGK